MHTVFDNLIESFKNTIIKAIEAKPEDRVTIIKENSYYISKQIEDLMSDMQKFDLISEEIFNEEIEGRLRTSPQEFIVQLDTLKKEFPETSILEEMRILLDLGDHYGELGSIDDFTKIEKFKITIFLNAIMYLQTGRENLDFTKLYDILSLTNKEKIFITIKRTLIHELSHILDSFQVDMKTLLKDFEEKEYSEQESELKAHECAFLYHFWKEGGADIAKHFDNFDLFKKRVEKMDCYTEIGPEYSNVVAQKRYNEFIEKIYNYFCNHNILSESKDKPIKKTYYVRPSDIAGPITKSEQKWAREVGKRISPETYGLIPKPNFFDRELENQQAIVWSWKWYPESTRKDLIDEVNELIKQNKLKPEDYLIGQFAVIPNSKRKKNNE